MYDSACREVQDEEIQPGSERERRRQLFQDTFSYDGYKIIRKELFAHLRDPAIVIRKDSIAFNTACINSLDGVVHIHVMFNEDLKRIVVRGCSADEKDALRWCIDKAGIRKTRRMNCKPFAEYVYEQLNWDKSCRYKILGYRIEYQGETLYVFDLTIPETFEDRKRPRKKGPTSGEEQNLQQGNQFEQQSPRKGFYAGDVANTFSVPVSEHQEESQFRKMDGYVSIGLLNGIPSEERPDQDTGSEESYLSEVAVNQETEKQPEVHENPAPEMLREQPGIRTY